MKNNLIPSIKNDNISKSKMSRSLVYSSRTEVKSTPKITRGSRVIYYVVAATSGILEMEHFISSAKIIAKGLRYTFTGKRKNMIKKCKLHPRVLNLSLTKKANGIRMGKGKGPVDRWVFHVRKGQILYTIRRGFNIKL